MTDKTYLFSIDLEDIRNRMPDGKKYQERVPVMVDKYLSFLEKHACHATFFVVGDVARAYPGLIKDIEGSGHEIACHSNAHIEIYNQTPEEFEKDLGLCIDSLNACGVGNLVGYRAPVFSLTKESAWAYPILKKMGITYSSSVLPADNPLNSWKEFGKTIKRVDGICEIPISIASGWPKLPFAGGVYFRTLPFGMVKRAFRNQNPVVGYFHTYDIDTEQERFMHPDIGGNSFYNFLLYYNRNGTLKRLTSLMDEGFKIMRYDEYVQSLNLNE